MSSSKFVAYFRVSTQRQGASGLGVEAQQHAVDRFLAGGTWELAAQFVEFESGRKGAKGRPELTAALAECKRLKATLVIAKLDRLARDVRFFLEVLDDSSIDIRFAEFADIDPKTDEGRMLLINMANFAEFEGRRIGSRTRVAIAAKKARVLAGTDKSGKTVWSEVWGLAGRENLRANIEERKTTANQFAARLKRVVEDMRARGMSQRAMVMELNILGIKTPRGGDWGLSQFQRLIARQEIPLSARDGEY